MTTIIDSRICEAIKKWITGNSAPFFVEFVSNMNYVEQKENIMKITLDICAEGIFKQGDIVNIEGKNNTGYVALVADDLVTCWMDKWVNKGDVLIGHGREARGNVESCDCMTMGVCVKNGRIYLHSNPVFVESLTLEELQGVLVHEIYHILNLTLPRKGQHNHSLWNTATDVAINEDILNTSIQSMKMKLPSFALTVKKIDEFNTKKYGEITWQNTRKYEGDLVSELIFNHLCNIKDDMPKNSNSGEGGSGEGGLRSDSHGEQGELTDYDKEKIKEVIRKSHARGYGNIAGNLMEKVNDILKPIVNWKKVLRKAITSLQTNKVFSEQTWSKISRKYQYLQGKKWFTSEIIIAVDTSGSTSYYDLMGEFFGEIEAIVKETGKLIVMQCDTEIQDINYNYKKNDWKKIQIKGLGGTSVQPVFDEIKKNKKLRKKTLVYFTDGEFSYDFHNYGIDTIWVSISKTGIPNGKNIFIPKKDQK